MSKNPSGRSCSWCLSPRKPRVDRQHIHYTWQLHCLSQESWWAGTNLLTINWLETAALGNEKQINSQHILCVSPTWSQMVPYYSLVAIRTNMRYAISFSYNKYLSLLFLLSCEVQGVRDNQAQIPLLLPLPPFAFHPQLHSHKTI